MPRKACDASNMLARAWCALINETRGAVVPVRGGVPTGLVFCAEATPEGIRALRGRGVHVGLVELLLIAVGVSMDAFAVSICKGLGMRRVRWQAAVVLGVAFGGFQALMPLVGWALGTQVMWLIEPVDHWVAFALLAVIGGKMLWEAFHEDADEGGEKPGDQRLDLREVLVLAVATSIDALAVGISFAALSVDIVPAVTAIGVTTFAFSVVGVYVGHFFGARWERPASVAGGVVLVLIGLKILVEHLGLL